MRRILPIALMSACVISGVHAADYTDKTYLSKRTHLDNLAMEFTTWHKQVARQDHKKKDRIGGTVQATFFYEQSNNDEDLGKYFGTTFKGEDCSLCCVQDFFGVAPVDYLSDDKAPVYSREIFHEPTNLWNKDAKLRDRVQLRPDVTSYGVKLDYHQKLDNLVKGLYFKASLPIVHVEHELHTKCVTSTGCQTSCGSSCDTGCATACDSGNCSLSSYTAVKAWDMNSTCSYSLLDYLTGKVTTTMQDALTKAKWLDSDETGIADIELLLGYNLWNKPEKHLGGYLGLIIPTGNTPDGEKLFEAVLGNGGHWAFVLGADAGFEIWKDTDKSLDLSFALKYKYLFSATEKRSLTFTHTALADDLEDQPHTCYDCKVSSWNHYLLGQCENATGKLFPLANVLTQDVKVTPGHQIEGLAALTFNYKTWVFDLGYNLFAREAEEVKVKSWGYSTCGSSCGTSCETSCDPCATTCSSCKYAVADPDYPVNGTAKFVINPGGSDTRAIGGAIAKEHLVTAAAETPSIITHKLFGGIGYEFTQWKYPVIMGVGGSYEWVSDNDALEQWALWAKLGLTF